MKEPNATKNLDPDFHAWTVLLAVLWLFIFLYDASDDNAMMATAGSRTQAVQVEPEALTHTPCDENHG